MVSLVKRLSIGICGVLLGLGATYAVLDRRIAFATLSAGPWTVAPRNGAVDIDPYARAAIARTGEMPLGAAEGLSLLAEADSLGRPLEAHCVYRLDGPMPPARFWTLTLTDPDGALVGNAATRYGFTSSEVLRDQDGQAVIAISRGARAGNWLPIGVPGRFKLMLRLYDTVLSSSAATVTAADLPRITADACN